MLGIKTSCNSWAVWHHIFSLSAATRDGQTIISKHLNAWIVCLQRSIRGPYSQKMRMSYNSVLSITSKLCKEQLRGGLWYPMKQTACHRDVSVVCYVIHVWKLQRAIAKLWAAMLLAAGSSSGPRWLFRPLWRDVTFLQTVIPPCRKSL